MKRRLTFGLLAASLLVSAFGISGSYAGLNGNLGADSYHVRTFEFTPGTYSIYAEGNRRTCDLDLKVYDGAGSLIASDTLDDNEPLVVVEVMRRTTLDLVFENYGPAQRYSGYIRSR
ncbi:MAG: hypothetical protein KF812_00775 [Fimbriimonadaceae bacterium]|nr:hypothetical protein [Fimbriimonadaceae bacterium]